MEIVPHGLGGLKRVGVEFASIAAIAAVAFLFFPRETDTLISQTREHFFPCSAPLTYRIGSIDPRFGLSTSSVETLLAAAAAQWNTAAGKTVLAPDPQNGIVVVDFMYDNRQQTASTMNSIETSVAAEKNDYAILAAQYDAQKAAFNTEKSTYDVNVQTFQSDSQSYENDVATWNRRGGAPADVFAQLQARKTQLDTQSAALSASAAKLNSDASALNALADRINALIDSLNLKVSKYNAVGAASPGQFEEGLFTSKPGGETIDIYEYATETQLHRVLAHEFGHSLGMEHVNDSNAIMYKLNESSNEKLTDADIQELDRVCAL